MCFWKILEAIIIDGWYFRLPYCLTLCKLEAFVATDVIYWCFDDIHSNLSADLENSFIWNSFMESSFLVVKDAWKSCYLLFICFPSCYTVLGTFFILPSFMINLRLGVPGLSFHNCISYWKFSCILVQALGSLHLYCLFFLWAYLLHHGWVPLFSGLGNGLSSKCPL